MEIIATCVSPVHFSSMSPTIRSSPLAASRMPLDSERGTSVVLSLILPGVKSSLMGEALRDACPNARVHWAAETAFSENRVISTNPLDQTIAFWAIVNESGSHVIHGREVLGFWRMFTRAPWITILGNPLWRAIDTFRNISSDETHVLHGEVVERQLTIGEFFASPVSRLACNRQSSKLVGAARSQNLDAESLLKFARQRLEKFTWVGLEGLDAGPQPRLAVALRQLDAETPVPAIARQRAPKILPDRQTREIIRVANSADFGLWDWQCKQRRPRLWGRGLRR